MILHSLRSRLILMSAVIAALVAIAAGLSFRRVAITEVERFASEIEERRRAPVRELLETHYANRGSWDGVDALLKRIESTTGNAFALSSGNTMIAVSRGPLTGAEIRRRPNGTARLEQKSGGRHFILDLRAPVAVLRDAAGREIGTVWPLPRVAREERSERTLGRELNRWLLLIIAAAGLAGLALSVAVARRIAGPIERLTLAVRDIADGRLDRRVAVERHDEIGALAAAFNELVAKLARNEELRRNMISDVAHELRTPLTNIRGELEAIQDGLLSPDRRVIDSLHEEVVALSHLIDDLQQLTLADAGQLRIAPQHLSLATHAERAIASVSRTAAEKGVRVESRIPPEIGISADPERLLQILRNLLGNAIAHTPAGGEVVLFAEAAGDRTRIQVRDTGSGIAEADLPFVFDRFYRADASRSRATGGAGLGLAIVKRLIELHGGTISVESTAGRGTTFTIDLPGGERTV